MPVQDVPDDFKQYVVNPLIKSKHLAKNELMNYRPISNFSFC